jgi:hypothetical protein
MTKVFVAVLAATAGLVTLASTASACSPGYKRVWIQGNPVCRIDASASNKLKAATPAVNAPLPAAAKLAPR